MDVEVGILYILVKSGLLEIDMPDPILADVVITRDSECRVGSNALYQLRGSLHIITSLQQLERAVGSYFRSGSIFRGFLQAKLMFRDGAIYGQGSPE